MPTFLWLALRRCTLLLVGFVMLSACEPKQTPMVAETDDEAADFGRTALINAIVKLSESPTSADAYLAFAHRVDELMPLFNRDVKREAELRLCVLAIGPLEAQLEKPQSEQMQMLALTVWPTVLQLPVREKETVDEYILRLCKNELSIECHNVVPEYWPVVINARVWRTLKSRISVAYGRCHWCAKDPDFDDVLETSSESHAEVESLAKDAQSAGRPSAWPLAGKHAAPESSNRHLSFGRKGWVTVQDERPLAGNWRVALAQMRKPGDRVGIHIEPGKSVELLLEVIGEVKAAGYEQMALTTRKREFPYDSMEYSLQVGRKGFEDLGVHKTDTIQVLVEALDYLASKK